MSSITRQVYLAGLSICSSDNSHCISSPADLFDHFVFPLSPGIAGHENMDMMFDQLNGRRFKPAMSVSGNMGNLQSMMDRMRAMMNG